MERKRKIEVVWEGPSVVKYKVTDTLRMESVGAGVGMSEEEVRELVSRPAGSKYALEEITGALNWVRRAMMSELGTEITIAPDCTRCRRPLSTHTPDTVCVAEEVDGACHEARGKRAHSACKTQSAAWRLRQTL